MAQTILVVDDHANVRMLIKEYLTELGYRVTHVAHRFGSALREISKENFDSVCCGA